MRAWHRPGDAEDEDWTPGMRSASVKRRRAFSLVELVVVVVIIGMLASMAIPRMSRGATGANEAAVVGNLSMIRNALVHYAIEHGNTFPGPDAAKTAAQLTQYSDASGKTSPTQTGAYLYGPYLTAVPPCPLGYNSGSSEILIDDVHSPPRTEGVQPGRLGI
jgi:prepilin-type N-terminal cleavage/methylation domain-containing protein